MEKLSAKEKDKAKKKSLYPGYTASDEIVPVGMKRLANGVISDSNDCHSKLTGEFSDCKDVGSYSDNGKQGERTGNKRGRSQSRCGRLAKPDGHKYKCHDGTLREDEETNTGSASGTYGHEVDAAYLKATIEQAVRLGVTQALKNVSKSTGCSVSTCARMINTLNKAERAKLYDKPKNK